MRDYLKKPAWMHKLWTAVLLRWTGRPILRIYLLSYELSPFPGCFSLALVVLVLRWFSFTGKQKQKSFWEMFSSIVLLALSSGPISFLFFLLWKKLKSFGKGLREAPLLVPVITGNFQLFLSFLVLGRIFISLYCHPALAFTLYESSLKLNLFCAFLLISSFSFSSRWFVITQLFCLGFCIL